MKKEISLCLHINLSKGEHKLNKIQKYGCFLKGWEDIVSCLFILAKINKRSLERACVDLRILLQKIKMHNGLQLCL